MFKTFGKEVLLAEDLNDIMRQTIIRVATVAEITALPSLDVGTVAYVEADDTYYRRGVAGWRPLLAQHSFSDDHASFFTTASGVSVSSGEISRSGGIVSVRLTLSGVTLSSGEQNVTVGTLAPVWYPATFVPWIGWMGTGGQASGMVHSAGAISVRNTTEPMSSGALILSATYPSLAD